MKNGSSLVVMPSSIPNSATREPDTDLSSDEESEEILEDSEDGPVTKKRVSDFDEGDDSDHKTKAMGMCLSPFFNFFCMFIPLAIDNLGEPKTTAGTMVP